MSHLEDEFNSLWLKLHPDIVLEKEISVIPKRKFRLDFAHVPSKIGIEIQGKIWHKGRHNTGSGLLKEYEKYNLHSVNGWRIFQLSSEMITKIWLDIIANCIKAK